MQPKQAIQKAKDIVAEMFADENPLNIGLEEIEYDDRDDVWKVTVGFDRLRSDLVRLSNVTAELTGAQPKLALFKREYKVVSINAQDAAMVSIKNHDMAQ